MATIRFVHADETHYEEVVDLLARADLRVSSGGEGDISEHEGIARREYFSGKGDEGLCLFEVRMRPGKVVAPHAHTVDEIFYILEGHLLFGRRSYGAGSAISIPARTLYGFSVGPEGVRFLNFRPSADEMTITKEDFGRLVRGARASQ